MPLNTEQMREYQRNRRKGLQSGLQSVNPQDVNPVKCKPVNPVCKPIVNLCKPVNQDVNPKAEYERGYKEGYKVGLAESKAMAAPEIASVASSCDTVYEPDPVKPGKAPKISVSKQALPTVKALLLGVQRSKPTVAHHPQCKCGVCTGHLRQASADDLAGVRRRKCAK